MRVNAKPAEIRLRYKPLRDPNIIWTHKHVNLLYKSVNLTKKHIQVMN